MAITKTIFIVDDDEDDLFLLQQAVVELKLNINVYYAYNGSQLLKMLNKEIENALILIDMNMPVMNGVETLRTVYADPDLIHLRSILMSTSDSPELKKMALEAGAMHFICKPSHFDGYLKLMKDIVYKCF